MLFLAIVFGFIFGTQAYNGIKHFIFFDFRSFCFLRLGLWLMCVVFDVYVIYRLWWILFIIGAVHLLIFMCFFASKDDKDYLKTPIHPDGKKREKTNK